MSTQTNNVAIDVADIQGKLSGIGVPKHLVRAALSIVPTDAIGILVYGSRARADYVQGSDLDLLALINQSGGSKTYEKVNMSCYTPAQLDSASGTLFGMHIRRDSIVLADTNCQLKNLIDSLEDPDPSQLLLRVRHFSAILDASATDLDLHLAGLCRLARYLLRTAIYSIALAEGRPCFSVRELAGRFAQPELVTLLSSDPDVVAEPSMREFEELCRRLRMAVGVLPTNHYGSLEALAIAEWEDDRERSTLAILAMTADELGDLDYSDLPKVLL